MTPKQHELFSSNQLVNFTRFGVVNLNRSRVVSLNRLGVVNFTGFCKTVEEYAKRLHIKYRVVTLEEIEKIKKDNPTGSNSR